MEVEKGRIGQAKDARVENRVRLNDLGNFINAGFVTIQSCQKLLGDYR